MSILFIFVFFLLIIFLVLNLLFYSSLNRLFKFQKLKSSSLKISILVAAKNEEKNISKLITSLKEQNYSNELYEVVIIDDDSSDNTFSVVKTEIEGLENFRIIRAREKIYQAKRGVLEVGIQNSINPYIVITDADCTSNKNWLLRFANSFEDKHDFVFGIAPYFSKKSYVNKITRFENLRAQILMFSFAKLGFPYSAASRSFGFTRKAFEKIGGYRNTIETLSGDDDLLLREAINNDLKIGMVTSEDALVFTDSKPTYSEYQKQKFRHTSTSFHYSIVNKSILGLWHITNLILLFSITFAIIDTVFILPFFLKIVLDVFLLNSFQRNFSYKFNFIEILIFQLIYEAQIIYFFLNAKKYSIRWD